MRKKIILIVTAVILFVMLAILIRAELLTGFETWVYTKATLHMPDILTNFLIVITNIGGPIGIALICLAIYIIPKLREEFAIPVSLSVMTSFVATVILKLIFERERPNILRLVTEKSYSFPSGHAAVNMAMYGIMAINIYRLLKNKKIKWSLITLFGAMVALIGFTRVYLGVHYAGDILAGWSLGIVVCVLVDMIVKKIDSLDDNDENIEKIKG